MLPSYRPFPLAALPIALESMKSSVLKRLTLNLIHVRIAEREGFEPPNRCQLAP